MKTANYKPYNGSALSKGVFNYRYNPDEDRFNSSVSTEKSEFQEDIAPYFPSKELQEAIEYARILKRPLLLRGEPGCGKTKVAQALAYELYHNNENDHYRNHYFEWFIKSTTKAQEGLYHFDHLQRLRDVQAEQEKPLASYRTFGPLGKAFLTSKPNAPSVLLIDEIDKASVDFPNDLLLEIDEKRFFIEETREEIKAEYSPIVIITSNDEKELPNAFLRRCVFHYIDFPPQKELLKIAKARVKMQESEMKKALPDILVEQVVDRFENLYHKMKANPNTDKVPSTSELLDLLRLLHYYHFMGKLKLKDGSLPTDNLPHPEVLFKTLDDYKQQVNK